MKKKNKIRTRAREIKSPDNCRKGDVVAIFRNKQLAYLGIVKK